MMDREPRSGETLPDGFLLFLLSLVYLSLTTLISRPLAASVLFLLTDEAADVIRLPTYSSTRENLQYIFVLVCYYD